MFRLSGSFHYETPARNAGEFDEDGRIDSGAGREPLHAVAPGLQAYDLGQV
jgi:hypothetical protein